MPATERTERLANHKRLLPAVVHARRHSIFCCARLFWGSPRMHTQLSSAQSCKVAGPSQVHIKRSPAVPFTKNLTQWRARSSTNGTGEGETQSACSCTLGSHSCSHQTTAPHSSKLVQEPPSIRAAAHPRLMSNGKTWPSQRTCKARLMTSVRTGMKLCR